MTPEERQELVDLQIQQKEGKPLTKSQQAKLKRYAPPDTLPIEETAPAAVSHDVLVRAAITHQAAAEDWETLENLLKEGYPDASSQQIREAITEAEQKTRLEFRVQYSTGEEPGGIQVTKYFLNSPRQGIVAVTRKVQQGSTPRETAEGIHTYALWDVTRHQNPLDNSEVRYSIIFQNKDNPEQQVRYDEMLLSEITGDMGGNQTGLLDSRRRIHTAISSLVGHMETNNLVRVRSAIPAAGYFEDQEGNLITSQSREFKVTRPVYNKVKTREALEALEQVLSFFAINGDMEDPEALQHALTPLYYSISGPLCAIRKMHGMETKILLMHGTPHTGKTIMEKLIARIWGLPEKQAVIGSSRLTAPQLAEHLSRTTYPLSFDEIRNAITTPAIADLLKSSTTGLLVKERIRPREGFRKQQFYAYATPILSTNFVPDLYIGLHERIIPVEFTIRNKRGEKEVKKFDKYFNEIRDTLPYIGAALDRLFHRRWSRVRDLILQADQVKAGYEILTLLYQEAGIKAPAWLREVEEPDTLEQPDPVGIICRFMQEDLLKTLRQHCRPDTMPIDWDRRLDTLKELNILPGYLVNISPKRITLNSGILKEVAKKGCEIPGSLQSLQDEINRHPQQVTKNKVDTYQGKKAIIMQREVFYAYTTVFDYQDDLENST